MKHILDGKKIRIGTCYYPEHWERSDWEKDLIQMKETGIEVIRIAEFSWAVIEPEEGVYCYELFDDFLKLARKHEMKVIFSTPTATPPAWLTEAYPEVLNADIQGNLYRHGGRRHYNYNSPKYRELCARIVEKYAAHYAADPSIIGWQIDNELNCETDVFYSESDTLAFREFLKKKYGSLEALNKAWGTVFWSGAYHSWEEVYVPRYMNTMGNNPHMELDFKRFISDSVCGFVKLQTDILKKYIKEGDFLTTNGLFGNLDSHRMTEENLDLMMYDSYPNFAYCLDSYEEKDSLKDRKWSMRLMETRSISPIFGIMEQQSGANGWYSRMEAPSPKKGQMTLWTMQDVAHGADYISYFRWRTCNFGTEMYWHGIQDYSGRENRRVRELREIVSKMERLKETAGSRVEAKTGILRNYDNQWDSEVDHWHERIERVSQRGLFEAVQFTHTPADYVYLRETTKVSDLAAYDVLFYPHAVVLTREQVEILSEYVEQGGALIFGCRLGQKDMDGKCVRQCLPGLASALTGADVPEYSLISPEDGKITAEWNGESVEAAVFMDMLAAEGLQAQVLARYENGSFAGEPALIVNKYGKGTVYYFGGSFTRETAERFLRKTGAADPWKHLAELPECCELTVREKEGVRYLFVLNYSKESACIHVHQEMPELLAQTTVCGEYHLEGYGALVLKCEESPSLGMKETVDQA